jgi:hypothetical protein
MSKNLPDLVTDKQGLPNLGRAFISRSLSAAENTQAIAR